MGQTNTSCSTTKAAIGISLKVTWKQAKLKEKQFSGRLKRRQALLISHSSKVTEKPISYFYRRAGRTVRKDVVFYLLETKTEQVRLSREHVGFDWFTYDRAMERLTYKNAKDTLQKAHEFLGKLPTQVLGEKSS